METYNEFGRGAKLEVWVGRGTNNKEI